MTPRYTKALMLAAQAHEGTPRKATKIPYIVHPVAVAGLVAKYGGDEDQQIAALLHDVIEDAPKFAAQVATFGVRVLAIVQGCTDGIPDASGQKAPWLQRKTAYLEHLVLAPADTLLVSGCDKLSNARSIVEDLQDVGPSVFARFSSTKEQTLWYYQTLSSIFTQRQIVVAPALSRVVEEMSTIAAR